MSYEDLYMITRSSFIYFNYFFDILNLNEGVHVKYQLGIDNIY